MKKFTKKGGFTLIELLVVIAIIGILASIVLVSLNGARKKGGDARVIGDVQQIRTTLETDFNGSSYPDLAANNFLAGSTGSTTIGTLENDAVANGGWIQVTTNSATPFIGYAVYGALPSQGNVKFFCISSGGATSQATSAPVNNNYSPC